MSASPGTGVEAHLGQDNCSSGALHCPRPGLALEPLNRALDGVGWGGVGREVLSDRLNSTSPTI